jgi:hypothetical protein
MEESSGVWQLVWEHLVVMNRVLHRLKCAGVIVSAKRLGLAKSELVVVGQLATYEGRVAEKGKVSRSALAKVQACGQSQGILGVAGTVRVWVEDFAEKVWRLVNLTKTRERGI